MGPVVDGQEHEGWVVPLFADGAQAAGASSARGVLVARRPDDGPRNGDRVRLTDHDGSAVAGIWQDNTVIGHAGIVHADTGGSPRCQVIDEVESDALTRRWSAGSPAAPAGWRGTPWARVPTGVLADPAARRLAVPGPWADLAAADETWVMLEWRRHIAGGQALEDVEQASWADIGRATGLTGRGATDRWSTGG